MASSVATMTPTRPWLSLVLALSVSCARETPASHGTPEAPKRPEVERALARLRTHETRLRRETRLETQPPSSRVLGSNPYRLCPMGDGAIGVLRGSSELVWLDGALEERARSAAPPSPSDCAVSDTGEIIVASELVSQLSAYRIEAGRLVRGASIPLPEGSRVRAVATRGARLFAADALAGTLIEIERGRGREPRVRTSALCRGAFALEATEQHLIAACSLGHALSVRRIHARAGAGPEIARIAHDGPFWGFDAIERDGALIIAAGGVENRPLERLRGQFGYVDSFVYVYRVAAQAPELLHAIDTADSGVLTPKAILLEGAAAGGLRLFTLGYGGDARMQLEFSSDLRAVPSVRVEPFVPGTAAIARLATGIVTANPLFDAWIRLDDEGRGQALQRVESSLPGPSPSVRLGEALFFTRLIAPWAESAGRNSRFTCETCHFEGGVDGRVHFSGRGAVRVSTKPLFGLLNNRPFFSRALDADLTSVSHHEFRVAGLGNAYDPWFALGRGDVHWLAELLPPSVAADERLDAETLRRALIDFLAVFHHEQNPWVGERASFSSLERRGAELFHHHCEGCHAARLLSDEPPSAVPFERWEALIFSESGPIVWARAEYEKTGIEPYVHARGTRVPSLRRLVRKWPYFTNGSSPSLDDVLARAAFDGDDFFHGAAPAAASRLSESERAALASFLRLL